jgi:hypothetical protein
VVYSVPVGLIFASNASSTRDSKEIFSKEGRWKQLMIGDGFCLWFFGIYASWPFAFSTATYSAGMPRAMKRAGELGRPQRRAGLETAQGKQLMDLIGFMENWFLIWQQHKLQD